MNILVRSDERPVPASEVINRSASCLRIRLAMFLERLPGRHPYFLLGLDTGYQGSATNRTMQQSTRIPKMKTKTLFIGAAILAAGLVTSPAQFFDQTFDPGINFCTPQLKRADMRAEVVLASSLQAGDTIYTWAGDGYDSYTFLGTGLWLLDDGNIGDGPLLEMGKGFIYNAGGTRVNSYTGRLSGGSEVLEPGRLYLIGSFVPVTANAEVILASCLRAGDQLYVWTGSEFINALYVASGEWYDYFALENIPEPVLVKGHGFFYQNNSGENETFSQ
jgi:hypothetical protein